MEIEERREGKVDYRIVATAVVAALEQSRNRTPLPGRGRGRPMRGRGGIWNELRISQCAYCKKDGQWNRECPELQKNSSSIIAATD